MLSVVKGVKNQNMVLIPDKKEYVKDTDGTPVHLKADTPALYNSHLLSHGNSSQKDSQGTILVNLKVPSKLEMAQHLTFSSKKKQDSDTQYDSNRSTTQKRGKLQFQSASASGLPLMRTKTEKMERKEALKIIQQDFEK